MKTVASSFLLLLLGWAIPGHADPQPLVVGQVHLSFYTASAAVVTEVLDRLGHPLQVVEGNHPDIYGRLGRGETDLLIASWLPNAHGHLQAPMADQLVEAATLYDDARLYWAVPSHVPAEAVRSIDDLKKPEVLARMDPLILGVGPGSGLMNGSERIMQRYGLRTAGYELQVAPAAEWSQRLAEASANGRWMVMPLWQPQYLNALYPLRILEDPQGIFGVDRAVVVVRKEVWQQLPERTRVVLGRVRLGVPLATELERRMMVDGQPAEQVARDWMAANPDTVATWFRE
ncbi:glycine betaine ABC transporter substrate-binding protein [Pseudomonas sp. Q1-7]|uniref:glycine betaine ABC transporter substrate-binding protein n=1 Tax=Pseudomonas sp. Q1-7 TaxID=3020843 RepID=UPI0023015D35|nr:glycine betaine ABC transporter substrate-binding protein [Pseudomonas sp. Q1-7]